MGTDESLARFRVRHDHLLAELNDYHGGKASRGEIPGWVARRLEDSVPVEGTGTTSESTNRDVVAVWHDLITLYQEFDAMSTSDQYKPRIVSLLNMFEYPIPTRVIALVVGCSKGHARRFYWDDDLQGVREKEWSLAQGNRQASPKQVENVMERDGRRCARCGVTESLVAHHIKPVSQGGMPAAENLVTLCEPCHRGAHDGVVCQGRVRYQSVQEFRAWLTSDE